MAKAHDAFVALQIRNDRPVPENKDANGSTPGNFVLRYLDRAVINHLHSTFRRLSEENGRDEDEFDTVRAMFPEGDPIYPGAGFLKKTHVQIAVRKQEQVLGIFRVPDWQRSKVGLPQLYEGF